MAYGFSGDRAYINNYEAQFDYFPVNFKGSHNLDTYDGDLIAYRIGCHLVDDSLKLAPFLQEYDLQNYDFHLSEGTLKILRHKEFTSSMG